METATTTTIPEALREEADRLDEMARESFERCDTDGFLSQWASGVMADKRRREADLFERGGMAEFPALFDLDGNLVAAKLLDGKWGLVWGVLASDDPWSRVTEWVTAFPKRPTTMSNKGYREGWVLAPAKIEMVGNHATNVHPRAVRTDGGFSRDAVEVER